jgi:small subunit ribosomal protein S6
MTGRRGRGRAGLFNLFTFLRRRSGGSRNPARFERREPDGRSHALREHASEPRDYEMMIVIAPTVGEEGLPGAIERVSGYITSQGGTVSSTNNENPWGRRRLAYQINDHRDALYVLYRFIARAEAIVEIEREIKLDTNVIRYLVVRYDELTEHEERPPRQQADGPGGPGGPSFRRPRPDAPAATATVEAPAEAAAPATEEAAPVAEEAESQPPATTDEPERPSGDPEAATEEPADAEPE